MDATVVHEWRRGGDEWVLSADVVGENVVASTSTGQLALYSLNKMSLLSEIKAHEGSVNMVEVIDGNLVGTCGVEGVRVWDLRSGGMVGAMGTPKGSPMISIASTATGGGGSTSGANSATAPTRQAGGLVAGGTELVGTDAELHIWDLRQSRDPLRSYIDSHHDDITAIKFHPTYPHLIMSGATDGYVNIYNMNEVDEDESLGQVINYASVHSCEFLTNHRVGVLSHMETMSFHDMSRDLSRDQTDPGAKFDDIDSSVGEITDFGDLRSRWTNCEYVIDLNPTGYVTYGANSTASLSLLPFNPITETFNQDGLINFPSAHGEEVVRALNVWGQRAVSGGEDGVVKVWEMPKEVERFERMSSPMSQPSSATSTTTPIPSTPSTSSTTSRATSKKSKSKKSKPRYKPY